MRQKYNNIVLAPLAVMLGCFLSPSLAYAVATFNVTGVSVDPGVGNKIINQYFPQLASQVNGTQIEALMNQAINQELPTFKDLVNERLLPLQDTSAFLSAMANSGAAASKSMPVDYATDPTLFSLSVATGVSEHGLSLDDFKNYNLDTTKPLPGQGAGITVSALLGLNLRAFDPPRWDYFDFSRLSLFVNFFAIDLEQPQNANFDVNFKTFGLHGQYQLFDSHALASSGLLRWGGLAVTTGFDYTSMSVLYNTSIPSSTTTTQTSTIANSNQTLPITLSYTGAAKLGADINIFSIPFEVTTHVQLAYILSIYVGGGFDLNFGSASLAGNASAPIVIQATNPQNPENTSDAITIASPDATLNMSGNSSVTVGDFRGYAGLQINLLAAAIFVQANADSTSTYGANAGFRLFW